MVQFKRYISRFTSGFETGYKDNGFGTGSIMYVIPQYQIIEALQFVNGNYDDIKSFIESKTKSLSGIHQRYDSPYIEYPITCVFDTNEYNSWYSIIIHPGDYLIWDEEIHRFNVLQESVLFMLYREV